jgi:eukaryotic-like serine/threonine-protein kinase
MTPDRWRQVTRVYGAVMTKPPGARAAALAELCPDDEALRKEVESLLADDSGAALLDRPLGDVAASVVQQDLSGRTLGPYRLESAIGAGGMGQVYRANDPRLHRTVAIKVLAPSLAHDAQFRARFEREAKSIAALNHPHICTLFDVGSADGVDYLVMEYVEGEPLSTRLERGALPFNEALQTAIQIADALAAAHRQGIVHRDLKPGNVMVTKAGAKLLDFGLAKPRQPATMTGPMSMVPTTPPLGPTRGAPLTVQGTILGTLQYMAPEQLEGKDADARTDIFAFGAIAYEMFTGKRAFSGGSQASLIGAIMHAEPPSMTAGQPLTPPALDRLVRICLAKDPDRRWQSIADVGLELGWRDAGVPPVANNGQARGWRKAAWIAVGVAVVMAMAAVGLYFRPPSVQQAPVIRFTIASPEGKQFASSPGGGGTVPIAVSPNGEWIVFKIAAGLVVRRLDSLEERILPDSAAARYPFWSPDSRFVAFFTLSELKKIDLAGGGAQKICDANDGSGGSWAPDGTILFHLLESGLMTVSASGGTPKPLRLTKAIRRPRFPSFLADHRHFLITDPETAEGARGVVYVGSLDSSEVTPLIESVRGAVYSNGFLLFVRGDTIFAQPFDSSTFKLTGTAVPLARPVGSAATGAAGFSVSANGVLAYADTFLLSRQFQQVDRAGRLLEKIGEPHEYNAMSLSADERRLITTRRDRPGTEPSLWVFDLDRKNPMPLAPGNNGIFSRDGRSVVAADASATTKVRRLWPSGEKPPETILQRTAWPTDWSKDGRWVVVQHLDATNQFDVSVIDLAEGNALRPVVQSPANEWQGRLSPNQQWIAYASDVTGKAEVYVRPFRQAGEPVKISNGGGSQPRWRDDNGELYYVSDDGVLLATRTAAQGGRIIPGASTQLFSWPSSETDSGFFGSTYVPMAHGNQFIVAQLENDRRANEITVVVNWPGALPGGAGAP